MCYLTYGNISLITSAHANMVFVIAIVKTSRENSFNANITDQSVTEILDLVKQLGNIYASEFTMDEDRNVEIDRLLTTYFEGPYDITGIMKDVRIASRPRINTNVTTE